MRQFLAQFRLTIRQWLALGVICGFLSVIVWLLANLQARNYQRMLDLSALHTVEALKAENTALADRQEAILKAIASLKASDREGKQERQEIRQQAEAAKRTVDQLKADVKGWP